MRIIVMFDLPTSTNGELREYNQFRRLLIKNGFLMFQESVYTKLALNDSTTEKIRNLLRKNKPSSGNVRILVIPEKNFYSIEYLVGSKKNDILDSDERFVVI